MILAGTWCLNDLTESCLSSRQVLYEKAPSRTLSKEQFHIEAAECLRLYEKYAAILASELNHVHSTDYSLRYWETLLNRFLYPLTATVVDKYAILVSLRELWPDSEVVIANHEKQWLPLYSSHSYGGSRLLHLLIYSTIVIATNIFPYRKIADDQLSDAINFQGDGKKDSRSRSHTAKKKSRLLSLNNKWLQWFAIPIRAIKRRELPFRLIKYLNPKVIALGNQYLRGEYIDSLMIRAGNAPFYFHSEGWGKHNVAPFDIGRRDALKFPQPESPLEESLQACIRRFLPTVFLENYAVAKDAVSKLLPKSPKLILNSQNHSGGELVDFFIAHSVEERKAEHMMVCHGGCYGAMEISVQEQIWARISDVYALWSNPHTYGQDCKTVKLPSLRFHKWLDWRKENNFGQRILIFLTGHYPQRYAYNSIYPYSIDDEYDDWQIRFLSEVDERNYSEIVIRDYHRSSEISRGSVRKWAEGHGIEVNANVPLETALRESKIAIQTVPQTTYLETLSANHPTLCFWNPKTNFIRAELMPYFDRLVSVGILHQTPESAARKLNEISADPLKWWNTHEVREAVEIFRANVCHTSPAALSEWAAYIRKQVVE